MPEHKVNKWAHDKWTFSNQDFVKRLGMPAGTPFFDVTWQSCAQKFIVHVNVKTNKTKDAWGREIQANSHETWEFSKAEFLNLLGIPVEAPVFLVGKNRYDGAVEIIASHREYPDPEPQPEPEPEGEVPSASEKPRSSWWTSITSRFRNRHP